MFNNWASSKNVTKFLTWQPHQTVTQTKAIIQNWVNGYKDENFYQWAIVLKELGEPIGSISVVRMDEETDMCHIGYCIGEKWWGKGIMTEALDKVIDFLFNSVKVARIESTHDLENPSSGRVMEKCNMVCEGIVKQGATSNRGVVDVKVYAILNPNRN